MARTRSDDLAVEVPVGRELRRLGVLLVVMAGVGAFVLAGLYRVEQTVTAVPGWGHCILTCSGVPLSTVERLSGVTFPKGSTVLEAEGVAPGGLVDAWVDATVRTPRAHQLVIAPASTVNGCLEPSVNAMAKWGVHHEHAGAVHGSCIQYGVTSGSDQIVHVYGAAPRR